jgi:hypothetical protein
MLLVLVAIGFGQRYICGLNLFFEPYAVRPRLVVCNGVRVKGHNNAKPILSAKHKCMLDSEEVVTAQL